MTTRQGHQDGQRLFEAFHWGRRLSGLPEAERQAILSELIGVLVEKANEWMRRQNLKLQVDRRQAPSTWVQEIVGNARDRSGGIVEQHLVGAKLERRYRGVGIPNHPAHAADRQTAREGDYSLAGAVYHVTAMPSRSVIQKCAHNLAAGLHPILLVPSEQENRARILAQEEGIDKQLFIATIESFVALNIIELATEEEKDYFTILKEIVDTYNRRLAEVETDLSLQIEVH